MKLWQKVENEINSQSYDIKSRPNGNKAEIRRLKKWNYDTQIQKSDIKVEFRRSKFEIMTKSKLYHKKQKLEDKKIKIMPWSQLYKNSKLQQKKSNKKQK